MRFIKNNDFRMFSSDGYIINIMMMVTSGDDDDDDEEFNYETCVMLILIISQNYKRLKNR